MIYQTEYYAKSEFARMIERRRMKTKTNDSKYSDSNILLLMDYRHVSMELNKTTENESFYR